MTGFTAHPMGLNRNFVNLIEEVASVKNQSEIRELLTRLEIAFELNSVAYVAINLPRITGVDRYVAATYSKSWIDRYDQQNYWRLDPVLREGFSTILPIDWGKFDVSTPAVRTFFGEAAEFGVGRQGLSFPVRGKYGEKALFSISSDIKLSRWLRLAPRWIRDFQVLSYHIHEMVLRAEGIREPDVKLTPRELECLKWSAAGKSAAEIGIILSLSEKTVRFYQDLARTKLDAKNLTHAVAKLYTFDLL